LGKRKMPRRRAYSFRLTGLRTWPSCLISWTQSGPDGGCAAFDGRHGRS